MDEFNWEDIEAGLNSMLIRYTAEPDLRCTEGIWNLLQNNGLTSYGSEIERHRILIRLFAVVEFVNDCSALIYGESYEPDLTQWAYVFELNDFRIAQLAGREFENTVELKESKLIEIALFRLMGQERSIIVEAIQKTHPNEKEIIQFLGNFYEGPNDDYPKYHSVVILYGELKIPTNVYEFYTWIKKGMGRRN